MGVHAIFSSAIKSVAAALSGSSAPAAVRHGGGAHPSGAAHVHLGEGAHPLLVGEAQAVKPSPGKALLQRIGDLSSTPMAALLERVPAHPAFMPLQRVADHLTQKTFGSPHSEANHQFVGSLPQTRMGGFVSMPQGPVFLPGGSPVPKLSGKEEHLVDPNAMQPAVTGRPQQHWVQPQQGLVPIGAKPSDFIHLSSGDDSFNAWLRAVKVHGEKTDKSLHDMVHPEVLSAVLEQESKRYIAENLTAHGPDRLAGPIERDDGAIGPRYTYMPPPIEVLGEEIRLAHGAMKGFSNYGIQAQHSEARNLLKVELNSAFVWSSDSFNVENYWGDGNAMTWQLLKTLTRDKIYPDQIDVRPSQLNEPGMQWWFDDLDRRVRVRDEKTIGSQKYELANLDVTDTLRQIDGLASILNAGYHFRKVANSADGSKVVVFSAPH